jgi:hypothetical protein
VEAHGLVQPQPEAERRQPFRDLGERAALEGEQQPDLAGDIRRERRGAGRALDRALNDALASP